MALEKDDISILTGRGQGSEKLKKSELTTISLLSERRHGGVSVNEENQSDQESDSGDWQSVKDYSGDAARSSFGDEAGPGFDNSVSSLFATFLVDYLRSIGEKNSKNEHPFSRRAKLGSIP
jgi:hypothetical protein